jgi:cell division septal protein FtsQ
MSAVSAPADRRFRRSHVKPSRTRRRWAGRVRPLLQYALAAIVTSYALYLGSSSLAHAHVLRVDRILVAGNERLSQGEVLAVLSGLRGESLVWTDLDRWRQRLLASPWVRDASLRRSLPSTVEVVVWEREPIAIGRINDDMYLIDERGTVIDQYGPQYQDLDLPIVDGLTAAPPVRTQSPPDGQGSAGAGSAAAPAPDRVRADLAARVIAALRTQPAIGGRLSQIDVSDVHNAQVILAGDAAVISLGEDQFLARLESYLDLAPALHDRVTEIDHVDVRFDNRVYVRPKKR